MDDKNLFRSLARLNAIKNNLPEHWVEQKYIDEYNSIIKILEEVTKESLEEFKVPQSQVRPRAVVHSPTQGTSYSRELYCDREYFLIKVDSVLGYFTLVLQPTEVKNQMGFSVDKNK